MSHIFGYSPDFQDAYYRRFKPRVESEPIFNEWVKEFNKWINESRIAEYRKYPFVFEKSPEKPPSKSQIKALAYEAKQEGLTNISLEMRVKDKRTEKGYRMVYRDVSTGKFAKNPYRELE